ncbi:hypothetical protein [Leifsonia poae]|uniref:Uncharacterized protein n=1 Tax=Leifsonia poae TaxID=110933 RepID=A0A9W6H9M3_9MICO|nr:hypothetical protein [Leifsonia poae]GLJ76106.1 hypothetical protein GCM10017584_16800 [Leifsonia poae]
MILDDTGRDGGESAPGGPPPEASGADGEQAETEFDPRFDPAFQRGYQPAPGERTRTRVRSQADADAPFRRPSPGTAPAAARVADAPHADAPRSDASRDSRFADDLRTLDQRLAPDPVNAAYGTGVTPGAEVDADVPGPDAPAVIVEPVVVRGSFLDGLDVSPRRNPYFLALWIIGGGFVILGVVLYIVSVFTSYTSSPTSSQDVTTLVFSQVGWMLAGPLIEVGLATIVALVILSALTARRAGSSGQPDDESSRAD